MRTRTSIVGLLVAVLALLASAAASRAGTFAGAPSRIRVPARVTAGESVELSWLAPDGVQELELEVSLDDGRTWARATPELPGESQACTWRVPDAASGSARLRLRVGTDQGEYELEPTETFRIELPAGEPAPLWPWPRLEGDAPLPDALGPPRSRLEEARLQPHANAPTRLTVAAPEPRECDASERLVPRRPQPAAPDLPNSPRFVPLRN